MALLLVLIGTVGLYAMSKSDQALETGSNDATLQIANFKFLMLRDWQKPTPRR